MSSFKKFISDGVLDPKKKELNPDVWPNKKLDADIKDFILSTFYDWLKENNIDKEKVKSVNLLGSIAGYQYGDNSDFDVNVVLDLPDDEIKKLRKSLPNGQKPEGIKYPVNYFVVDKWQTSWEDEDNGIYDVEKDKWLKQPDEPVQKPYDSYKVVEETARFFIAGITSVIAEYKADVDAFESFERYLEDTNDSDEEEEIKNSMKVKVQEIIDDINSLKIAKKVIKNLRDEAFNDEPLDLDDERLKSKRSNDSLNNLLYKYIEKLGYFEKIEKITDTKDEWINKQGELE